MINICLDPGHGGNDSGVAANGIVEKIYNLTVCNEIKRLLSNYNCIVKLTRSVDKYVTLEGRCSFSNNNKSDCFISIHVNFFSDVSVNGFETFSYYGNSDLQNSIHKEIISNVKLKDRGMKKGNYAVLRNTRCKALIVECGFLSNKNESEYLKKNINVYAKSVANGLIKHYNLKNINSHIHCECIELK